MRTRLLPGRTPGLVCVVWLLCWMPGREDAAFSQQGGGRDTSARATDFDAMREEARQAILDGRYEAAADVIRRGRLVGDRFEKDAWCLVEAELECTRGRYAKGGLAAMRVVILRSTSLHVGRAFYWAGRAYEGLNRPAKAIELYNECVAHESSSEATRKMAAARLMALGASADSAESSAKETCPDSPQQEEPTSSE